MGVRVNNFHLNVLDYADDLNLISTTPMGLQILINECHRYANEWRMKFNPIKSNIVCIGKKPHRQPPVWTLADTDIGLSDDANVLGTSYLYFWNEHHYTCKK